MKSKMNKVGFLSLLVLGCLFTLSCSGQTGLPLPEGVKAEKIIIEKSKRQLSLWSNGVKMKTYQVSLGRNPVGPKQQAGDKKTPEGLYIIDYRKEDSRYHLALHISYPNSEDIERASQTGISPGSDIMIHGMRNGLGWIGSLHRYCDWTQGCIAVTNAEIEEIWRAVPDGTPIEIKP